MILLYLHNTKREVIKNNILTVVVEILPLLCLVRKDEDVTRVLVEFNVKLFLIYNL